MNNDEEAKRAIEELNGAEVEHRTIVVNEARERTENTGSFGGGNNNRRRNNSRGRSY
jgi:RNA recognition motif-containing protein